MKKLSSAVMALGLIGAAALSAHPAQAKSGLVLQALNSATTAGGNGSFDVNLVDLGGTFSVSGFSFELTVPGASGVTFTNATAGTSAVYIFGTLQSSPFSFSTFPTTDVIASDSSFTPPYFTTLSTGDTFGLGHLSYTVAPGTSLGPVTVSIVPDGTSLSDVDGNPISFTSSPGTIVVAPTVPEASTPVSLGVLLALGLGGLLLSARRSRQA